MLLSAAMSADGYLDDASRRGRALSDAADWDRVDELRAASDAILVGARTVRADNPRLVVKSAARRDRRVLAGLPGSPQKVTITGTGELEPRSRFFTDASMPPLVYVPAVLAADAGRRLAGAAVVVAAPAVAGDSRLDVAWLLTDLAARGVGRLMVEGGGTVLAQFLLAGLADELQLAIAPVFIADPRAPRLLEGARPGSVAAPMRLAAVGQAGETAVLRYLAGRPDRDAGDGPAA